MSFPLKSAAVFCCFALFFAVFLELPARSREQSRNSGKQQVSAENSGGNQRERHSDPGDTRRHPSIPSG
jgi:hypothetical protein